MHRFISALCALSLATLIGTASGPALAQQAATPVPPPPGVPTAEQRAAAAARAQPTPVNGQITSTPNKVVDNTGLITEHKRKGDTHLIEARPKQGATMYLEDSDGDGQINSKDSDLGKQTSLPKWKIGKW